MLDDYTHVEEETVKYGYKDPSLDLLHHSYFHIWDNNGQNIGLCSFANGQHIGWWSFVEGEGGEEIQVGEGGDDEDYERETPPGPTPSNIDDCDWDGMHSWHDKLDDICLHTLSVEFLINVCLPSCLVPCTWREWRPIISLGLVE